MKRKHIATIVLMVWVLTGVGLMISVPTLPDVPGGVFAPETFWQKVRLEVGWTMLLLLIPGTFFLYSYARSESTK